jgi:TetR/AcrR family transcriptional regulator, mexJK operon transcriptional repressor
MQKGPWVRHGGNNRLIAVTVQAERFPELERLAHEEGWLAAVNGVARVLVHYVERKEVSVGDPELAADMFLNLVLGHAPKTMDRLLSYPRTREATEKRVQAAVRLFLEGVRVR